MPLYRFYFKKLPGAVITSDTFEYYKTPGITAYVSKFGNIFRTANITVAQQSAAGAIAEPQYFIKELLASGKVLTGITIKALPYKAVYNAGNTLDTTGMVVEAEYSDETTAVITGYTYQPTGLLNEDIQNIVASYTEGGVTKSAEFDIVVRKQPGVIAGNGNIHATLSNASAGGTTIEGGIINSNNPVFQQGLNNAFAYGTEITLTAQPIDGMSFLYWKNSPSDRVVSTKAQFTFKIGSNTQLTAVYKKVEAGKYHVEFYDKNGKVLQSNYLSSTDKITPPKNNPFTVGYEFRGWNPGVPEYATRDEAFIAQYEKENKSYQLTVNGPAVLEKGGITNLYNTEAAVAVNAGAIPEGQRFLCWKRDGKVVGYENKYSFYVWDDTEITAVLASNSAEIAKTPQVMMDKVKVYSDPARLIFMSERIIPDGYEYIESGILLKQGFGDENTLNLTDFNLKAVAQSTNVNGQFAVRRDNVTGIWYARAYIIYKDGTDVKVVYSNIVNSPAE